jgi:hypothetical protein
MASKNKNPKKPAAKPQAKKAPAKKERRLTDIVLLTDDERIKDAMKDPKFKAEFDKRKDIIIQRFNLIKSPPSNCKIIVESESGLTVLLQIQPSNPRSIHRGPCAVTITTFVGRVQYFEQPEFTNLRRACEYIKDFGQEQAKRFTEAALNKHANDVMRSVVSDIVPMLESATVNNKMAPENNGDKKEVKLPYEPQPKAISDGRREAQK